MANTEEVVTEAAPVAPSKPPVLGQGVHYVLDDYSHLGDERKPGTHLDAAIVEIFDDEAVTLRGPGVFASPVSHDEGGAVGTWHWPEPVKE